MGAGAVSALALSAGSAGAAPHAAAARTRESQAAMTPEQALQKLKDGNERFIQGKMIERDLLQQVKATGPAQFPFAAVVGCIDSREAAQVTFDQGIGDVFSVTIAGNFVNDVMLGSLEFACAVAARSTSSWSGTPNAAPSRALATTSFSAISPSTWPTSNRRWRPFRVRARPDIGQRRVRSGRRREERGADHGENPRARFHSAGPGRQGRNRHRRRYVRCAHGQGNLHVNRQRTPPSIPFERGASVRAREVLYD